VEVGILSPGPTNLECVPNKERGETPVWNFSIRGLESMSQEGLKYIRIGIVTLSRAPVDDRAAVPEMAYRVSYWRVDDIEFIHPPVAVAIIDRHARKLIP